LLSGPTSKEELIQQNQAMKRLNGVLQKEDSDLRKTISDLQVTSTRIVGNSPKQIANQQFEMLGDKFVLFNIGVWCILAEVVLLKCDHHGVCR
jgi:hypothetical protein